MKIKNSIIASCLAMSAAVAGAVDWNNPQLSSADMSAIKVVAPAPKPVPSKPLPAVKVTLSALKHNPAAYLGKTVVTEAVVENDCAKPKHCFVLRVARGSREVALKVIAWLPIRAPRRTNGKPVPTMADVVNKHLILTGKIEKHTVIVKRKRVTEFRFRVSKYKAIAKS